jgi:pimeloyl-ACP methyl ester carboxylesterase
MIPPLRFVEVTGRRVTWRAAGSGPAAVLVHGSPQSSRALTGLGEAVAAAGLCAIMPDTPGAGHSTALSKPNLEIHDLAVALAAFADAIGLGRFALYGTHTGAAIALAFAVLYPDRVTTLVLDGLAAWTDAERAAYRETYAPPFVPSWDGAHLTWLWSRMEAQSQFFPWHQQTPATFRNADLSPPWHLHRNAMDMLDSGDAYRPLYQASLAFDPAGFLSRAIAPQFLTLASDVLRRHAARPALAAYPVTLFDDPAALWKGVAANLAANPGDEAPNFPVPGLFHRGTLEGSQKPLILLHPAGASSRVFERGLDEIPGPVLAFDLPGHGFDESEPAAIQGDAVRDSLLPRHSRESGNLFTKGDPDKKIPAFAGMTDDAAKAIAARIDAQCRDVGLDSYVVAGQRFGGVIAQAMGRPGVTSLDIGARSTAPDLAAKGAVSLAPEWDGAHLLRAWRVAWRQAIWDPWYENTASASRAQKRDLSPAAIHEAAVDLLRAGPAWLTANAIEAAAGPAAQKIIPPDRPDLWPSILSPFRSFCPGSGQASAATAR